MYQPLPVQPAQQLIRMAGVTSWLAQAPLIRRGGALLALLLLGALLVWLQDVTQPPPYAPLPTEHGEPDYYIEQARAIRYNAAGERLQILESPQVTHYPENNLALMDQPRVHHYGEDGQIWRITANKAEYRNQQEIYLEDRVRITPLNPDSPYLPEFATQRLWVDLPTEFAHTPDPVTFTSPGGITHGKGLNLKLDTGQAEIPEQAQGQYHPQPDTQDQTP